MPQLARVGGLMNPPGGLPSWLLPGLPSLQFDWDAGRAWLNGIAYYDEASFKALLTTFSTPAHLPLGSDGKLYLVGANSIDAFYMPGGVCRGQTVERGVQNKNTNYNANPPALVTPTTSTSFNSSVTNMTAAGDAAALYGVVDDSAAMATGILSNLYAKGAINGRVYKIDNSAGSSTCVIMVGGITGNTNAHSLSVVARAASGTGSLQLTGGEGSVSISSASYSRIISNTVTPGAAGRNLRILANAGAVIYFMLNQLEEASLATSPIIVAGAAVTRSASAINRTLGSEFNSAACALFANWITSSWATPSGASENAVTLDSGSTSNRLDIYREATTANSKGRVTAASVLVYGQSGATGIGANTRIKGLLTATTNNMLFTGNGVAGFPSGSAAMPSSIATARFGMNSGGNYANGPIAQTALWKTNSVTVPTS